MIIAISKTQLEGSGLVGTILLTILVPLIGDFVLTCTEHLELEHESRADKEPPM